MTKTNMKEQAINTITTAIWATEHMEPKSKRSAIHYHAQAQGKIQMARALGIITKEEYEEYWDANNQASYNHPACFENA